MAVPSSWAKGVAMSLRRLGLALVLLAAPVAAQCFTSATAFTEYGVGCSGFGQDPPSLSGTYSAGNCTLSLSINGWGGNCPNICPLSRVLAFGVGTASLPLPFAPCDLLVTPDVIVAFTAAAGTEFDFPLNGAFLVGITIYAQAAIVFSTIPGPEYEITNGLQMTFS
jgi:hypothetical protein